MIPKAGLTVRDPETGEALPKGGALKPKSTHWRKRLKDGDVTLGSPAGTQAVAKSTVKDKEPKA
ncbi:MAG: DUF2635 domain-containing protein [Rhodospirillum sp.]|nr:DUF2635 domain-containing protein [Rhodospirillum sp.]MCF8500183.1 DUF2635 domain-containing protein [Rhodospirillum sp.]